MDRLPLLDTELGKSTSEIPVADIEVGARHRHDMGNIDELAQNIDELGLLHPIVVTPPRDGRRELIAGARRLLAYRSLGRERIPATVLDLDQIVRGEYAENFFRKAFTPSEFAEIADALEPIERQAAKKRQREAGHTKAPGNFPEARGPALDHVARAIGKDRKTIAKAREVRDAAKADPARFGELAADMDRTGHVDGPYKRLKVARQAETVRAEPLTYSSHGPYRVVVADPPWPFEVDKADLSHRATQPSRMFMDAICTKAPKVQSIAHEDCVLWLWTTNYHMRYAYAVLGAWGFQEKTVLTWVKNRTADGEFLRERTEHCILAVRGRPTTELSDHTTVLNADQPRRWSGRRGPDAFYGLVESLCPAPRYIELFSFLVRENWDAHWDEVLWSIVANSAGCSEPRTTTDVNGRRR
jgi:N6-adenosine-specific RNA methylase IME4/ParB-like chromosome segregation protein Spo0J